LGEIGDAPFDEVEAGPGGFANVGAHLVEVAAMAGGEVVESVDTLTQPEQGLEQVAADEAGHAAAIRWKAQLDSVGARVDAADFAGLLMADGTPAKDLNDLTRLRPEDQPQLEDLIPNNENAQP